MAFKKKAEDVIVAYRLINVAKISKMEDSEKIALVKAVRQLKKISVELDDFIKDAQERLKTEELDAIIPKIQDKKNLSVEENAILKKYNEDVAACISEELSKEVEFDFELLSEDALGRFVASNDFSISEIMTISGVIGA